MRVNVTLRITQQHFWRPLGQSNTELGFSEFWVCAKVRQLFSEVVTLPWLLLIVFFGGPLALQMALVPAYSCYRRYWEWG